MTEPTSGLWPAVDALTNPTRTKLRRDDGTVDHVELDSLWVQLCDAVGNSGEGGTGSSKPGSRPPADLEALTLLLHIEWVVAMGCRTYRIPFEHTEPVKERVGRTLRSWVSAVVSAKGDVGTLEAQIRKWVGQIRDTVIGDRIRPRRLRGHRCITCGSAGIRRDNADGEPTIVWPLMLTFSEDGQVRAAECEACGEVFWRGDDLHRLVEGQAIAPAEELTA